MRACQIHTETIKDQIYNILRQQIMDGTLRPGDKIVEQSIADQLNVSRSPAREAIKQLVGDGFLTYIPNRGAFVKKLSPKEVLDTYDVRLMLELYSISHVDSAILSKNRKKLMKLRENIRKLMDNLSITEYLVQDKTLHEQIVQLSNNSMVNEIYDKMWGQISSFRSISLISDERLRLSLQEHIDIIDALLEGDFQRGGVVLERHLSEAKSMVQGYLEGNPWFGAAMPENGSQAK